MIKLSLGSLLKTKKLREEGSKKKRRRRLVQRKKKKTRSTSTSKKSLNPSIGSSKGMNLRRVSKLNLSLSSKRRNPTLTSLSIGLRLNQVRPKRMCSLTLIKVLVPRSIMNLLSNTSLKVFNSLINRLTMINMKVATNQILRKARLRNQLTQTLMSIG